MRLGRRIALMGTLLLLPVLLADDDRKEDRSPKNVLYVHSNNWVSGTNSVLAYTRDPASGTLTEIKGSPFLTGGTGYLNSPERLGPDDTDQQITPTADHRFLYVVNEGSNTIAGFAVQPDGSLKAVKGSPFPSGGVRPVSIGIHGNLMIVANQGDQLPGGTGGTHAPTYASFRILEDGALHPLSDPNHPQPALVPGSSPTQALFSPDGKLLFDANFSETPFNNTGFPPFIPAFSSQLHSYKVGRHGHLTAASQIAPPQAPFILGLQVHPQEKILYAGFVLSNVLGTYSYDEDGIMTLVSSTAGTGAGMCWVAISKDLKNIYTSDAVTDQIDVFSIAADPLHPVHIQNVALGGLPMASYNFNVTASRWDTTPFQLQVSPDGGFLYVLNHEESLNGDATGNALHILKRGTNGMLTEPSPPLVFPAAEVANNSHPLGVLVF
jgi:6-phosphogluconolactonase (cycloisomerase 2 family)